MARTAGKRSAKASVPAAPAANSPSNTSSGPPAPFKQIPSSIQPFVSTLPTDHIYLVHLDRTPVELKRRVFLVPVLLNLAITLGLCVRIYYAAPVYLQQIITIFGYDTAYSVDTASNSLGDLMSIVATRFSLLSFDYALFALLGSWPKEFLFGSKSSRFAGPWDWRRNVWFKETEVVVRQGRNWDTPLLEETEEGTKTWTTQDELTIKFKIEPAMRPSYASKTGLLLLDKDWNLDFKAMVDAHRMVKDGRLKMEDLEGIALVHYQKQWLFWKVNEDTEIPASNPERESVLQKFRDKLMSLGQEDVFFRWIEIMQFETSQPGGLTEARQAAAMQDLKKMLTNRGVDYAAFWKDIGGQKGLPGLDQTDI
jgi:hypothetical protein